MHTQEVMNCMSTSSLLNVTQVTDLDNSETASDTVESLRH